MHNDRPEDRLKSLEKDVFFHTIKEEVRKINDERSDRITRNISLYVAFISFLLGIFAFLGYDNTKNSLLSVIRDQIKIEAIQQEVIQGINIDKIKQDIVKKIDIDEIEEQAIALT